MEARAIQRTVRQSARKMRLVIDQIRGKNVSDALALLTFSKKHAAKQIANPATHDFTARRNVLLPKANPATPSHLVH